MPQLLNRNRCTATVAPVDHAAPGFSIKPFPKRFAVDHAVTPLLGVFDQTFFEKVCGQAFFEKIAITPASRPKRNSNKLALLSGAKRAPCCCTCSATPMKSPISCDPEAELGRYSIPSSLSLLGRYTSVTKSRPFPANACCSAFFPISSWSWICSFQ